MSVLLIVMEWNCSIYLSLVHASFEWHAATHMQESVGQIGHFSVSGLYITPGIRFVTQKYTPRPPRFIRLVLMHAFPVWRSLHCSCWSWLMDLYCVVWKWGLISEFHLALSFIPHTLSCVTPVCLFWLFFFFLTSIDLSLRISSLSCFTHFIQFYIIHWEGSTCRMVCSRFWF